MEVLTPGFASVGAGNGIFYLVGPVMAKTIRRYGPLLNTNHFPTISRLDLGKWEACCNVQDAFLLKKAQNGIFLLMQG